MQYSLRKLIQEHAKRRQEREEFLEVAEFLASQSRSSEAVFCCWMLDALKEISRVQLDRQQLRLFDRVIDFYREWLNHRRPTTQRWEELRAELLNAITPVIIQLMHNPAEEHRKNILLAARAATDDLNEFLIYAMATHETARAPTDPYETYLEVWFRYSKRLMFYLQMYRQPRSETEASFQQQLLEGNYALLPIYCDWLEEQSDPLLDWLR